MSDPLGTSILKGVSRSFYLTLRMLPGEMRGSASLGYLLARISDTIADTESISGDVRIACLQGYARAVAMGDAAPAWPEELLVGAEEKERNLLEKVPEILDWLKRTPKEEADLVRDVVETIISGQTLDLTRFMAATGQSPVALSSDDELDDYTWRVAGCVGAFWTKLGFLTLGHGFSRERMDLLEVKGILYGKGLQLVNILRDLPKDLEEGRCYLPVEHPSEIQSVMAEYRRWHHLACEWVREGFSYADTLKMRRLRAATVLPALIAEETLERLDHVSWGDLQARVKVPRAEIYRMLVESFLF